MYLAEQHLVIEQHKISFIFWHSRRINSAKLAIQIAFSIKLRISLKTNLMLYQRRGVYTTPTHRKEIKVAAQLTFRSSIFT